MLDLKESHALQEDVVFLFVGKTTEGEVVNYEPWKVTGDELLDLFLPNEKKKDWLEDQHLSRLSRQHVNGLHFGRNSIGTNHKLFAKQLRELLLFNLSMIFESEVEYFETVSNLGFFGGRKLRIIDEWGKQL